MKCVEVYKELYHQEPFDVAFCPYRISPLGAHIDHQYGKINGLAIDKGIHMAYHPKQNGVVELQSLNFPKRAQFFVSAVPDEKQGDWADHLRGAAKMLGEKYRLKVGLSGIIEGSLPIGGLSSSASVIICFLSALCKVNAFCLQRLCKDERKCSFIKSIYRRTSSTGPTASGCCIRNTTVRAIRPA